MNTKFYEEFFAAANRFVFLSNTKMALGGMNEVNETMRRQLTSMQQHLIIKLRNDGPMQLCKIAEFFNMKPPNATRFANELVKKGWCEKRHSTNKSKVFLALSESGEKMFAEDKEVARAYYIKQFETHATQEERCQLLEFYNKVNEILSRFP